jgi:hypothetical protein
MNTTTLTIESVHGIKQTIVLVPNSNQSKSETVVKPLASESKPDEEDRLRSSK